MLRKHVHPSPEMPVAVNAGASVSATSTAPTVPASPRLVTVTVSATPDDGKLDLAVATNSYDLQVLFGNGDGTFQPGWSYASYPSIYGLVVGDFNGDGVMDIVEGVHLPFVTYAVNVRLGGATPDLATAETHSDGWTAAR